MIRVNLLAPERPTQKKKATTPAAPGVLQAYLLLTLFAGGMAFACAAAWWYQTSVLQDLDTKIAADEKRQRELQAIKVQVDAFQAKKTLLENKVNLIERLKAEQKGPVHLLDEISKALPDFVWLTNLDENSGRVTLVGESNGLTSVADFISALQRSGWFPNMDLVSSDESNNIVKFNLQGMFLDPELAAKQRAAAAAAAAPPPPPAPAGAVKKP